MSVLICAIVLFLAPLVSASPDEPLWSMILGALLMLAVIIHIVTDKRALELTWPTVAVLGIPAIAILSLLVHWLIVYKAQPTNLDSMARGTLFWLSAAVMYLLVSNHRSRKGIYATLVAITAGAAVAAGYGLQDYLIHVRAHESQWREFGTSNNPDFYAGYLVSTFPLALAMFLGAKTGKERIFWLPYLLALLLQIAVIPTTGSRFAIISSVVGAVVVLIGFAISSAADMAVEKSVRIRLAALVILALLGGSIVAKPILFRVQGPAASTEAHSGNFRVWTWKGTIRLIESDPLLGAGPGQFINAYPKRAIVGFTRHAHSAYLQTAADIGVPALCLLLAAFAGIGLVGMSSLRSNIETVSEPVLAVRKGKRQAAKPISKSESPFDQMTMVDDRFLVMGLTGSLAAALIQNLIDSDWIIFSCGITLFALAGTLVSVTAGFKSKPVPSWLKFVILGVVSAASVFALLFSAAEMAEESGNYVTAAQIDPINSAYQKALAFQLYLPERDAADSEAALIKSASLAPGGVEYYRLGSFYLNNNELDKAQKAYELGLGYDPNSVQLLIALAQLAQQMGDSQGSLRYYQKIADLETTPYGTVRAIPEISETRFVDADAAVGDSLLRKGMVTKAISYYLRAKADCEEYSNSGGASSGMRKAMNMGEIDNDLDSHMRGLTVTVMTNLAHAYDDQGNSRQAVATREELSALLKSFPGGSN